jgi:hypothetical protein
MGHRARLVGCFRAVLTFHAYPPPEIKGVTHAPAFRVHSTRLEGVAAASPLPRQSRPPRRSREARYSTAPWCHS